MAERIKSMRTQLHKALQEAGAPGSWDHVINQRGMFSFTGLNKVCGHPASSVGAHSLSSCHSGTLDRASFEL